MINVHGIKLSGDSEFSNRFNIVSDMYQKWEESIGTLDEDRLWKEYQAAKYCLEQGIPFGTSIEDHIKTII